MRDNTRQLGKITSYNYDVDHSDALWITLEFEGSGQSFGGHCIPKELQADYERAICATFGVDELKDLVGKKCYALRCFNTSNEPIEGLEAMSGKRFISTTWLKKHFPLTPSPLERRISDCSSTMSWAERRWQEAKADREKAAEQYVEWK